MATKGSIELISLVLVLLRLTYSHIDLPLWVDYFYLDRVCYT